MTPKPIRLREQARLDAEGAVDYYHSEAGGSVALGFINMLEKAYRALGNHPAAGSLKYAYELNLPGLRSWPVKKYPYIIFYVDLPAYVEIWRILHAQRDIAAWMHKTGGTLDGGR
jgi:toxin ParE1/3/4